MHDESTTWILCTTCSNARSSCMATRRPNSLLQITTPGVYAIGEQLSGGGNPMITVMSPNVTIDCKGHFISGGVRDILVQDVDQIRICNGVMAATSTCIAIVDSSNVMIEDMIFTGGLSIGAIDSSSIDVLDSNLASVSLTGVTNSSIDECAVTGITAVNCTGISVTNVDTVQMFLTGVTNSIFDNIYRDGAVGGTAYTLTNCSNNIFSNITRSNANAFTEVLGTSSNNLFENVIINQTIVPIVTAATVDRTQFKSCTILNGNPSVFQACFFNDGTNTKVYNTTLDNFAFVTSAGSMNPIMGFIITDTNVVANDANYWENLFKIM